MQSRPANGLQSLGSLVGFSSRAKALSDNGVWLMGDSQISSGHVHVFALGPANKRHKPVSRAKDDDGGNGETKQIVWGKCGKWCRGGGHF